MKSQLKKLWITHKVVYLWRLVSPKRAKGFKKYRYLFENKRVIEIGGPTPIFQRNGLFPIYSLSQSVDNCNFNSDNFWSSIKEGDNFYFDKLKKPGKQFILDGADLGKIPSNSYDVFVSSHVIEHLANPIKALKEWVRTVKDEGHFFIVIPHKDATYDWKRPITTLEHIITDYKSEMPETDTTHFEEVLKLHDIERDQTVGTYQEHENRTLNNKETRIVHHHVFDTLLGVKMVDHIGLEIIDVWTETPFHIAILCRKPTHQTTVRIDNSAFMNKNHSIYTQSVFPSDKLK